MKRKTTRKTSLGRPSVSSGAGPRKGRVPSDPVLDLRDALFDMYTQGFSDMNSIDEISVRVAGLWPAPTFQAVVKFRNRTLPWATFVAHDPVAALEAAVHIAMRGPQAIQDESTAKYYHFKPMAQEAIEALRKEFPDLIVDGHVELEPSMGWVPVIFTVQGASDKDLLPLAGRCEIREIETTGDGPRPRMDRIPRKTRTTLEAGGDTPREQPREKPQRKGTSSPSARPKPSTASVAAQGDMRTWKKSALIKYHQEQFGKQPNNKLSVDEIVDLIETKMSQKDN